MKAMMVMSILLNLAFVGGIGGYYMWRGDEFQWFIGEYNRRPDVERELIRDTIRIHNGTEEATEEILERLLVNDELKQRLKDADSSEKVQALLVDALRIASSQIDEQTRQSREAVLREQIAAKNHQKVYDEIDQMKKDLAIERENFELDRNAYREMQEHADLKKLIDGIQKEKKPEIFQEQVNRLAPREQLVVARAVDAAKWAMLFNAMAPNAQQEFNMARTASYSKTEMELGGDAMADPAAGDGN